MPVIKSNAVVLKGMRFGDSSRIVTLFTREHGKISAIAKGVRKFRSNASGTLEAMNYISVVYYHKDNRELQTITAAEFVKSFSGLTESMERLQAGFKVIEILNKSVLSNEHNHELFDLLVSVLSALSESSCNQDCIVLCFQLRLAEILGIGNRDLQSSGSDETFFDSYGFNISNDYKKIMDTLYTIDITEIQDTVFDKETVSKLIAVNDRHLSYHTHGGRYYNSDKVFSQLKLK